MGPHGVSFLFAFLEASPPWLSYSSSSSSSSTRRPPHPTPPMEALPLPPTTVSSSSLIATETFSARPVQHDDYAIDNTLRKVSKRPRSQSILAESEAHMRSSKRLRADPPFPSQPPVTLSQLVPSSIPIAGDEAIVLPVLHLRCQISHRFLSFVHSTDLK